MNSILENTGKKVKVAVIDDGYIRTDDSNNIYMYDYLGNFVTDSPSRTFHGKQCIEIIKTQASDSIIYSIDATDYNKMCITEHTIAEAINFAIELNVDIINISQGLDAISNKLNVAIHNATNKNILICASCNPKNVFTYPANLNSVFAIRMSKNAKEISYNNGTFLIPQKDVFFLKDSKKTFPIGHSFATAYMTALCAKTLEFNPLVTYDSMIRVYSTKRKNQINDVDEFDGNIGIYNYDFEFDINNYKPYLKANYKYYFNHIGRNFKTIDKDIVIDPSIVNNVVHINPYSFAIDKENLEMKVNEHFLGNFKNIVTNTSHENISDNKLNYVNKPIVATMSYGESMDKFDIQFSIYKSLMDSDINVANFSFNPLSGVLKDSFYIKYPNKVEYPNYIYEFNNKIYINSLESDIVLLSFPGLIDYSHFDTQYIGNLYKLLLTSINIDIIILSVSNFILYQELKSRINELTNTYGAKVYLYVSQNSKSFDILHDPENADIHLITSEEIDKFKEVINMNFPDQKVFSKDSLSNNELFEEIVKQLS